MWFIFKLFLNELSIVLLIRPIGRTRRITFRRRIANRWERTVVVEEVLYTFGVVVLVRFSYGPSSQGALAVSCKYFKQSKWPFMAAYSHASSYIIILTLNKIFEYVEMTILSRPSGSIKIPRRFDFFA